MPYAQIASAPSSAKAAAEDLANSPGSAIVETARTHAEKARDVLGSHLDTEEPVLATLFPRTPEPGIAELRKAIVAGAPRSGPDPPVRLLRPLLLHRYRARKQQLLG